MIALRKRTIGAAARMIPINLYTQMFFQSEEGANTNDRLSSDSAIPTESCKPSRMAGYRIGRDQSAASLPASPTLCLILGPMRQCPPCGLPALFVFCGVEPRKQRERAHHLAQVVVAAAVDTYYCKTREAFAFHKAAKKLSASFPSARWSMKRCQ